MVKEKQGERGRGRHGYFWEKEEKELESPAKIRKALESTFEAFSLVTEKQE